MLNTLLAILMIVTALFLILLVLIQRGRGGGLAGAFGGMGGQSAFGTKAGDMFTRITIGVAAFWIILCVVSMKLMGGGTSPLATNLGGSAPANMPQSQGPAMPGGEGGAPKQRSQWKQRRGTAGRSGAERRRGTTSDRGRQNGTVEVGPTRLTQSGYLVRPSVYLLVVHDGPAQTISAT